MEQRHISSTCDRKYRCWITDRCKFSGNIPALVHHFGTVHVHHFNELPIGSLPFRKSWDMNYVIGENIDCAIKIRGLVFIVHLSVNHKGEFGACVLMYTRGPIADQYYCTIQIEYDQVKLCHFKAKVISADTPKHIITGLRFSGLPFSNNNQLMYTVLRDITFFKCTVTIQRKNGTVQPGRVPMDRAVIPQQSQLHFMNDQLAGSNSSTQWNRDRSAAYNQIYRPQCELNQLTIPPMLHNCYDSSMPSAPPPYEPPPPYNPEFSYQINQQQQQYSEDVKYAPIHSVQRKKQNKACVVS